MAIIPRIPAAAKADPRARLEALLEGEGVTRADPGILLPADPYFDLAGEEFGQRLLLTVGADGVEYCLRPDFTLPIARDYLSNGDNGAPATRSYLGPVFRQRTEGPAEFTQAGLELIGHADPEASLDRVLRFAGDCLGTHGLESARTVFGSVEMFEAVLGQLEMPDVWRPRIRHRFGHPRALARLLERLANPPASDGDMPDRAELVEQVTESLVAHGLSLNTSRSPEEIVDRLMEKKALDAARVPAEAIATLRIYLGLGGPLHDTLAEVEKLAAVTGMDLAGQVERLGSHAAVMGSGDIVFDAGFSPRLDYYTGIVFEMLGVGETILASGGQYDRLMERLGAPGRIAAAGCAVWVDRLAREAGQ